VKELTPIATSGQLALLVNCGMRSVILCASSKATLCRTSLWGVMPLCGGLCLQLKTCRTIHACHMLGRVCAPNAVYSKSLQDSGSPHHVNM